jgi:hypothetical protein
LGPIGGDTEKILSRGLDVFLLRSNLRGLLKRTPFLAEVLRMGDFAADFLQKQQTARRPRCVGALPNSLLNREKFPVSREFSRAGFHGAVYAASCPAARRR